MRLKRFAQLVGQHGQAVLHSLAFADDDLVLAEVEVFDAQAHTFHQAEAGAIEQFGHQLMVAGHLSEDGLNFVFSEHNRKAFGLFGANDIERLVNVQM